MAAAALVRSIASKMSRAAAPTAHHRSLVARGLHGRARSGPATSNQVQQGTADALVSVGMAAATRLGSGAGPRTTKLAPPPPPPPYHRRLVHGRGIHSRTSPDPIPFTPPEVLDITALDKATDSVAYIARAGCAVWCGDLHMHFWVRPVLEEVTAMLSIWIICSFHLTPAALASAGRHGNTTDKGSTGAIDKLGEEAAVKTTMHYSQENRVEELEAIIMDLKAEVAELKVSLHSARSQRKV